MTPIPVFLPMHYCGCGSIIGYLIAMIVLIYFLQVVIVWIMVIDIGDIGKKSTLLFWHIPIFPIIMLLIKKFKKLN